MHDLESEAHGSVAGNDGGIVEEVCPQAGRWSPGNLKETQSITGKLQHLT